MKFLLASFRIKCADQSAYESGIIKFNEKSAYEGEGGGLGARRKFNSGGYLQASIINCDVEL